MKGYDTHKEGSLRNPLLLIFLHFRIDLFSSLNKNGACSKTIGFHEAIEALEILEDIGEAYTMTPDLMAEYSELKECKYR